MRLSLAATEFVEVPVAVDADPTGDDVFIAIVDRWAAPTDADFVAADWKDNATAPYIARLLVGPDNGDIELTARGWHAVYVKATDTPEHPLRSAGLLFAW